MPEMKSCYRALVMRVTEVHVEIWADSYEEAVSMALDDDDEETIEVETVIHDDQLVDVVPWENPYEC